MNPLALGLPLALPSLSVASQAAGSGLRFLKSLLTPASASAPAVLSTDADLGSLQRAIAQEVRRGGFDGGFALEAAASADGRLTVLSDSPHRQAIEQRLNANPYIVQQFRTLAERAGAIFRLTVPAGTGVDASA